MCGEIMSFLSLAGYSCQLSAISCRLSAVGKYSGLVSDFVFQFLDPDSDPDVYRASAAARKSDWQKAVLRQLLKPRHPHFICRRLIAES
jgi:hypothetical protein